MSEFDNTVFGILDRIGSGIRTYFDARIAINESQAQLALSEKQKDDARKLNNIDLGIDEGVNWGVSEDNQGLYDFDNLNPQLVLAVAGVALLAFVAVRS